MIYRAIDVAHYIINYSAECKQFISNLKLNKLLYFIQAWFLISKDDICFCDEIEAWEIGPIIPDVYRKYAVYGCNSIPELYPNENIINKTDAELIQKVINLFKDFSAYDMTELTFRQKPWENKNYGDVISVKDIKEYFSD